MTAITMASNFMVELELEREERAKPLGDPGDRERWNAYRSRWRSYFLKGADDDFAAQINEEYSDGRGHCPNCSGKAAWPDCDPQPTCLEGGCSAEVFLSKLVWATSDPAEQRVGLEWASEVTPERIEWLWRDRLPLHDLAVLAGEPGLGKSTATVELAALITRGELDGALYAEPRTVLIASAEDHFGSVIYGRLLAAGAVMERVASVTMTDDGLLAIPGDVDELARLCGQLRSEGRPVALIVVDPISAYLGGLDSNRDVAVRGALAPLAKLAQTERVCVLTVGHLTKSAAGGLLSRLSGSGAFGAAPRSVLAFARDPGDPDGEQGQMRVLAHVKSNFGRYAPTLAAHIEAPWVEEVGSTVSRLVLDGETDVSPEDLRPDGVRDQSSAADVEDAILEALTADARPSREVKAEVALTCGVATKTVERNAMRMLDRGELESAKIGFPARTIWRLPQWGRASGDSAVPTGTVPTDDRQQTRAIPGVEEASRDTHTETSLLDDSGPSNEEGV